MEKSTPVGLVAGLILIYGTIFMGEGWATFFDVPSLIIVIGGTFAGLLVSYTIEDVKQIPAALKNLFQFQDPDLAGYVHEFSELARMARREGLLALDRRLAELDDDFLCFGLEMAVDGIEEHEVADLLKDRIKSDMKPMQLLPKFMNSAGNYAPAFGMIGTLIGLIQMLQNLTDPSAIGAGMSVAMVTTFYGAFLANLFFLPLAAKAKGQVAAALEARQLMQTGILGIVRGESPSMIEKRLQLYLKEGAEAAEAAEPTPLARAA